MTRIESISTGDSGFDLVLGNTGLRVVRRLEEEKSSCIVLIRGAPGTGKTAMAIHLALVAARARKVAVGYACVEILPGEIEAQCEALWPKREIAFGFGAVQQAAEKEVLVARLVDVQETKLSLDNQLDELAAKTAPGSGPVLVIDSLLRGSALGSQAEREVIDGVCKYAVDTGAVLFLVEEATDEISPWAWSVDTVIELHQASPEERTTERSLSIAKHRFAPCDPGPHRWAIVEQGVALYPRPATDVQSWVVPKFKRESFGVEWTMLISGTRKPLSRASKLMQDEGCCLLVSHKLHEAQNIAMHFSRLAGDEKALSIDLRGAWINGPDGPVGPRVGSPHFVFTALSAAHSSERDLSMIWRTFEDDQRIRQVILGDLSYLTEHGGDEANDAWAKLVIALLSARVSVVMYQRIPERTYWGDVIVAPATIANVIGSISSSDFTATDSSFSLSTCSIDFTQPPPYVSLSEKF